MDIAEMRKRAANRMPRAAGRWYDIRNSDGPVAVLRIYDEIHWLWGVSAEQFAEDLDAVTADEIRVEINSPGGDVFDGIAIFNALRSHPAKITTRVDGIAASIASVIAQAGDERVMLSGSQMMVHEAWGLAIGPASDMREMADMLDRQCDVIAGIYAERAQGEVDHFRQLMTDETWLTADEAVTEGLADAVVTPARKEASDIVPGQTKTLHDELVAAMAVVASTVESAERVDALRAEKGKSLSQVNRESLDELRGHMGRLQALLDEEHDDVAADVVAEIRREHMRLLATHPGESA